MLLHKLFKQNSFKPPVIMVSHINAPPRQTVPPAAVKPLTAKLKPTALELYRYPTLIANQ
jgi:hypothetical protein